MVETEHFGLAASGRAGPFNVEVLEAISRPNGGWFLSVESSAWCFEFELSGPGAVGELAVFLGSNAGRTVFAKLLVGSFGTTDVFVIKDDEFADRFFIRAAGGGSLVEFTLVGEVALEFAASLEDAAAELKQ